MREASFCHSNKRTIIILTVTARRTCKTYIPHFNGRALSLSSLSLSLPLSLSLTLSLSLSISDVRRTLVPVILFTHQGASGQI